MNRTDVHAFDAGVLLAARAGDDDAIAAVFGHYRERLLALAEAAGVHDPEPMVIDAMAQALMAVDPDHPPDLAGFEGDLFTLVVTRLSTDGGGGTDDQPVDESGREPQLPAPPVEPPAIELVPSAEGTARPTVDEIPTAEVAVDAADPSPTEQLDQEMAVGFGFLDLSEPHQVSQPVDVVAEPILATEPQPAEWQRLPGPIELPTERRWPSRLRALALVLLGVAGLVTVAALFLMAQQSSAPVDGGGPSDPESSSAPSDGDGPATAEQAAGGPVSERGSIGTAESATPAGPSVVSVPAEPERSTRESNGSADNGNAAAADGDGRDAPTTAPPSDTGADTDTGTGGDDAGDADDQETTSSTSAGSTSSSPTSARPVTSTSVRTTARVTSTPSTSTTQRTTTTRSTTTTTRRTTTTRAPNDFAGLTVQNREFRGEDLRNADFRGAVLDNVVFDRAELDGVDFTGASLRRVRFTNTDLTNANLRGTVLDGTTFEQTNISGVDFTGSELRNGRVGGWWWGSNPPINRPGSDGGDDDDDDDD